MAGESDLMDRPKGKRSAESLLGGRRAVPSPLLDVRTIYLLICQETS